MSSQLSLNQLGWQPFFQQQLNLDEYEQTIIARVTTHHRDEYILGTEQGVFHLPIKASLPNMVIGDWLLLDHKQQFVRLLERKSLFKRKSAGSKVKEQLIVANVDKVFIVCSLNHDFNLNRIERYLSLAHESGVEPIVVLTKRDLCDDVADKCRAVQQLDPMMLVESVNALDSVSCQSLLALCRCGQTLSVLGSSGVGKSTLVNTLLGVGEQETAAIREDDSKGRHTTTARSMHFLSSGAVLIDTPGMREIQLADSEDGIKRTFADINLLAEQCRFSDCQHRTEPGCVIQQAIQAGELDPRRLTNYLKLLAEQGRNSAALHEKRAKDKQFGKTIKSVLAGSRQIKKGY
jgi:ribosome biogenesis GTPase